MDDEGYPPVGVDTPMAYLERLLAGERGGKPGKDRVISTGSAPLDKVLNGGLRTGQLVLVGGVAGVGTSTFALGLARAACRDGIRTAFLAPDSSESEVLSRVVAAEATVQVGHIRAGELTQRDRQRLEDARDRLAGMPLWVQAQFSTRMTTEATLETVEYMTEVEGVHLAVIDGTSQMEPTTREFVRRLRTIAQARRLAIVVTSKAVVPMSRRTEPPILEDLREYEAVADLFDVILMIHRDDARLDAKTYTGEATISVAKNRYGPQDQVLFAFHGHFARFPSMDLNWRQR